MLKIKYFCLSLERELPLGVSKFPTKRKQNKLLPTGHTYIYIDMIHDIYICVYITVCLFKNIYIYMINISMRTYSWSNNATPNLNLTILAAMAQIVSARVKSGT